MNSWNRVLVVGQAREHFLGSGGLTKRRTQAVAQGFNVKAVFAQNQCPGQPESVANAGGLDQRVAVAVATDPRAEADEGGQVSFLEAGSVDLAKRIQHVGVDLGESFEKRQPEVTEAGANLVVHGGLGQANFVGLPEGSDLGADGVFAVCGVSSGQGKPVKIFELPGNAAAF